ncbi:MAG: diadenylate cyclase CdaA [Lachnospiraceae bacterium]
MQTFLQTLDTFKNNYLYWMQLPRVNMTDIVEIVIITLLFYNIMVWIKNTRAWMLFKGILVLLVFTLLAAIFQMNTILWIAEKTVSVGIIAVIVVFQPELRKALEQLGRKNLLTSIFSFEPQKNNADRFSEKTMNEMVKATFEMAKVKTGALLVIEKEVLLTEYERTGINLDSNISSQLLINIFEHNTPLHDGAVLVRGDRVVSATCYLPLSDNLELSKELGTRHRAAVGISEVSDSLTIVVSEETGKVSVAEGGILTRDLDSEELKKALQLIRKRYAENTRFSMWKRRLKGNGSKDTKSPD